MPLVQHLEDAAGMAGYLHDHFLPRATRSLLSSMIGIPEHEVRTLASWLAGLHDVCKATPEFASQAMAISPTVVGNMRDNGLEMHPFTETFGHPALGQVVVKRWLRDTYGADSRTADSYACVIGGHHGTNPPDSALMSASAHPTNMGSGPWVAVREEILGNIAQLTGADRHLAEWTTRRLPLPAQVLLSAIVIMADWMASNQELFPYLGADQGEERVSRAASLLGLPDPWAPAAPSDDTTGLLHRRFPALSDVPARGIQSALADAAHTCTEPSLFIVEAPMGVGKTEAALMAAEILASRFGCGGVFLGLPTMATANPMFDRTLAWLDTALGDADASVALAHGKAGLNDHFTGLPRPWYGQVYDDEDPGTGRAVVNTWLAGRKRAGLASFVVGTIDQGLFVALKAKHLALRHLALAGKVVIIDEAHAADQYMRHYLRRLLTWLGTYRTPVILMSATLPPDQRDDYVKAYAEGRGDRTRTTTDRDDTYPRITCYPGPSSVSVTADSRTTRVSVRRIPDDPDAVLRAFQEMLSEGGCAGVLCNTVARAQEMYRVLRDAFGDEVELTHSRFLAPDRARHEASLVERLGRGGIRPHRLIVVGTQVLEQSLDIDFDVLVTDFAPADLVLQRIGRLHRHERERPALATEPMVYLRGVEDWDAPVPTSVPGSRAIYGPAAMLRAAAVLQGRNHLTLPAEIPTLVRLAYDPELTPPDGWEAEWASAEQRAATDANHKRAKAESYLLEKPAQRSTLVGWIDVVAPDPDSSEEQGRSQVRDSDDGLEVIGLVRDDDSTLRLPSTLKKHAGAQVPTILAKGVKTDESIARAMAGCTLPLPLTMCNERDLSDVIRALEASVDYSGWQESPWLKGQLAVPFDSQGNARVARFNLHYDTHEGLTVTTEEST